MKQFEAVYKQLNKQQQQAVNTVEGPLLVIAGPGTGKTQLLSVRVANILRQPDTTPSNILCLTFTDNAARNMRERLENIIGQPAHHVAIHTFHSFGVDIINQYPDFFTARSLLQPIDELGTYQLLREIFETLPHNNPLSSRVGEEFIFLKSTLSIISWLKHNALSPEELRTILADNSHFIQKASGPVQKAFSTSPSAKQLPVYQKLAKTLASYSSGHNRFGFIDYGRQCTSELEQAIANSNPKGRYVPSITAWRNVWLEKDARGNYQFKDSNKSLNKMQAVAGIYQQLHDTMSAKGLYDFDDMILEVVHALEQYDELRFNLQERYQYILVDEFQDTNKAQLRILQALGDNPVNEGKPNIMVVGDDDQAIYAFQGAEVSNMLLFMQTYPSTTVITLTDNYRSTQSILDASVYIMQQAESRITNLLPNIDKTLLAKTNAPIDIVEHDVLPSELQQYQWIAEKIKMYLKEGYRPDDIAIIAPKHKYLERLMPYLAHEHIPVAYERRENILEAPIIRQIIRMAELVDAIAANQHNRIDALISEVLSYPFWQLPVEELARISLECYDSNSHWLPVLLKQKNTAIVSITKWFLECAKDCHSEPLEYILDRFMGTSFQNAIDSENTEPIPTAQKTPTSFISPMRAYYFSEDRLDNATDEYLALLGQLSTLRHRLRTWKPSQTLYLRDLVEFVDLHNQAKLKIIDTNPHTQSANAVQVMTAYKAKGLEFAIVFAINAQDEVWGPSARSKAELIRLPRNIPIKPAGDTIQDKLRLFFVAITRAKHILHLTSYTHNFDNKLSLGLSFVGGNSPESRADNAAFVPQFIEKADTVSAVQILSTDWAYRYRQIIADKPTLFEPILERYKLNITHLNNFIDITNHGPYYFLVHNLLRFPEAMSPHAAYGDAIHQTLQWAYGELRTKQKLPNTKQTSTYFDDILSRKHLPQSDYNQLLERGKQALRRYLNERKASFSKDDIIERGFGNEGVVIQHARLSGKIDKITPLSAGSFAVSDFKTGAPAQNWKGKYDYEKIKLHKYEQQLMFYKLLIEHSATYSKRYSVAYGALDFIEADDDGKLVEPLRLEFDNDKLARFSMLIGAVWQHILSLNFPDTSKYTPNYQGVLAFEQDLIDGQI